MDRTTFLMLMLGIAALILLAMFIGWRRRLSSGRDLHHEVALVGSVITRFEDALYVSTTPADAPLQRLAIPGLEYRGRADVTIRTDGIEVCVRGERAVGMRQDQVQGATTASSRVGKAVGADGLSILQWRLGERDVESSFRLRDIDEQLRFAEVIDAVAEPRSPAPPTHHT